MCRLKLKYSAVFPPCVFHVPVSLNERERMSELGTRPSASLVSLVRSGWKSRLSMMEHIPGLCGCVELPSPNPATVCVCVCVWASSFSHLFVSRSTSRNKHHMETCESRDWNKEQPCDAHHHQTGHKGQAQQQQFMKSSTQPHAPEE